MGFIYANTEIIIRSLIEYSEVEWRTRRSRKQQTSAVVCLESVFQAPEDHRNTQTSAVVCLESVLQAPEDHRNTQTSAVVCLESVLQDRHKAHSYKLMHFPPMAFVYHKIIEYNFSML